VILKSIDLYLNLYICKHKHIQLKRNYFLFDSYFTKIFIFWFLILTAGNTTAQSATIENISVGDSVACQAQRIAKREIAKLYVTKGTFIVNNEVTNADIVTIPDKIIVKNSKAIKSERKASSEEKSIDKEVIKYTKPIVENKILFNEDHHSSDSFSNNTVFFRNIILPEYKSGKLKAVLLKSTKYYTSRISNPYVEHLLENIFADHLIVTNFFTRPPPTISFFYDSLNI